MPQQIETPRMPRVDVLGLPTLATPSRDAVNTAYRHVFSIIHPSRAAVTTGFARLPYTDYGLLLDAAAFFMNPASGELYRLRSDFAIGPGSATQYMRRWFPERLVARTDVTNLLPRLEDNGNGNRHGNGSANPNANVNTSGNAPRTAGHSSGNAYTTPQPNRRRQNGPGSRNQPFTVDSDDEEEVRGNGTGTGTSTGRSNFAASPETPLGAGTGTGGGLFAGSGRRFGGYAGTPATGRTWNPRTGRSASPPGPRGSGNADQDSATGSAGENFPGSQSPSERAEFRQRQQQARDRQYRQRHQASGSGANNNANDFGDDEDDDDIGSGTGNATGNRQPPPVPSGRGNMRGPRHPPTRSAAGRSMPMAQGTFEPNRVVFVGWARRQLNYIDTTAPGGLAANDTVVNDNRVAVSAMINATGRLYLRVLRINLCGFYAQEHTHAANIMHVEQRYRTPGANANAIAFDSVVRIPHFATADVHNFRILVAQASLGGAHQRVPATWLPTPADWANGPM